MDLVTSDDSDKRGRAAGRMKGLRREHENDREGDRQRGRQPDRAAEELEARHAGEAGDDVAADEVPRLGQGALDGPIDQDGRCAEGSDEQRQVPRLEESGRKPATEPDAQDRPDPGPEELPRFPRRADFSYSLSFSKDILRPVNFLSLRSKTAFAGSFFSIPLPIARNDIGARYDADQPFLFIDNGPAV